MTFEAQQTTIASNRDKSDETLRAAIKTAFGTRKAPKSLVDAMIAHKMRADVYSAQAISSGAAADDALAGGSLDGALETETGERIEPE